MISETNPSGRRTGAGAKGGVFLGDIRPLDKKSKNLPSHVGDDSDVTWQRRTLRSFNRVTPKLWEMSDMVKVLEDWEASQAAA